MGMSLGVKQGHIREAALQCAMSFAVVVPAALGGHDRLLIIISLVVGRDFALASRRGVEPWMLDVAGRRCHDEIRRSTWTRSGV